ncbi:T9SS type A sorting domain-containing protein [Adhaeribacter sp. BT258]|uniref:T9SS type A sorting domain-containing protein n=1 Tax=Adhaeribacter terrigena TaxID=2793070 RepID=A0ABS1BZV8_9BACT|nr:T9SS type A sorting domain-containing protein [Adhaeribacter terrigena]MBK0401883.1 T9SS type A sorting domain-containing protein [Adhaeribacter terrigena]
MKKHLLFYLVFLLLAINAMAQVQQSTVVSLGTGTTASKDNGPIVVDATVPTGYFSRHIGLYMASDISAVPFTERVLTKIAWYKDNADPYVTTSGAMKIYIKQTALQTLSPPIGFGVNWNTHFTGATEVYTVNMPSISSGAGWKEFVLPKPFTWDGTSNLEVFVEWTGVGTITNSLNWRYTTGAATANTLTTTGTGTTGLPVSGNIPDIRFTFSSFNNDGGVTAINAPVSPVTANVSTPVTATIKNFGINAVTTATIGWKVNGIAQPDYTWSGNLASQQTDGPVTLGNYTFLDGSHTVKAYTKTLNGVADPLSANDTTTVQLVACSALSGNYTINKNAPVSATNFQSFNAVAQALNTCGVAGPVIITVTSGTGPYNESVTLTNVLGTSATNTLTFEGSGNTITSANEIIFKLNNADYVKLNNLVITNTNTGQKCAGVQLINNSDFFTLSNSTINMPQIAFAGIVGIVLTEGTGSQYNATGNFSNNSLFQNNIINGGYYGIRMHGQAGVPTGSAPTGAVNNHFINNQIREFSNFGISLSNADGTKIEGNIFTRPTRTDVSNFQCVVIASGSINTLVNKNRFHNSHGGAPTNTGGATVISIESAAAAGSENIIKNNLIYNINHQGVVNVISMFSNTVTGAYIYHNTISIENPNRPATNTSNIRAFTGASGVGGNVKFINNIISVNMPGTGNKHAIYLGAAPAATFVSNNNVLYLASGQTNAFTGAIGATNYATLANWQVANTTTPYDVNSVAINPAFTSLATGDLKPTALGVNNIGVPVVPTVADDFMEVTRNATTPDPGAYEFDVNDAGVSAITAPNSGCNLSNQAVITITVNNFGTAALSNIPVSYTINGGTPVTAIIAGPIAAGATATYSFTATANLSTPGSYSIVASTNLAGDALAPNDAFTKVVVSSATPAIPTITAGGPTTFCTGGSVVLTAASTTTGATFTWFKDGVAITGATAVTYTATTAGNYTAVATANGCASPASAVTTVTVNSITAVPTITAGGPTTFCTGGSVTLTAASTTTGATFAWYRNGTAITGATAATYSASMAGNYTAIATANGCSSGYSTVIIVTVNTIAATPTITASGPATFCTGGSVVLTAASTTTGATYTWSLNGTPITGATSATYIATTAGNYTAIATANGCASPASAVITVTVNAAPAIPTIAASGTTTICAGGSVTLTAASTTAGATYTWSLNGSAITGATAATYTANTAGNYTATAISGTCTATSAATVLTVTPLPATPTITRNGFTLTSSSATGNQWYKDSNILTGETNATYNATANGSYTVVFTDNGCSSAISNAVNITNTGLADDLANLQVAVFPNPSTGIFNVTLPENQTYKLLVTDLTGKVIQRQTVNNSKVQLDIHTAAKGIYLLRISGENGLAVRKLVVE